MSKNCPTILAAGEFPSHPLALKALLNATPLVCCDGATKNAILNGYKPDVIIGDLDSLPQQYQLNDVKIIHDPEQETNDLAKALRYLLKMQYTEVTILGATGLREDHALGNLAHFADFAPSFRRTTLLTNTGTFYYLPPHCTVNYLSTPEQPISVIPLLPDTRVEGKNLRWPLHNQPLSHWWQATLNKATADHIELTLTAGKALLYIAHPDFT